MNDVPRIERSTNTVNALIHLYRAEVGRLTAYRVRLDTTTNWAITSSVLVSTFALGPAQAPHETFLLLLLLNYFFLHLEARRFRAYETSRHRVLLLEHSFFPEMLGAPVAPHWTDQLLEALRHPELTVNYLGSLGWRLRRNYLWIYTAVGLAWLGKLYLSAGPATDLAQVVARAAVGPLPGPLVLTLVATFYMGLAAVGIGARRIYPFGDEAARRMMFAAEVE